MSLSSAQFQKKILAWFDLHGRKHLPWQLNISAYRVWISEIMLQQTQVSTVIPYFERFMQELSTISQLAQASEDTVLHLWSGLGYYSRARNLHRAAQILVEKFNAKLPDTLEELISLPGIGRSTAGAILALGFKQPATILDGNVKRVLTRFAGIETAINLSQTEKLLWTLAEKYTPTTKVAEYTQAMMDMGATLCTRTKPRCLECPLQSTCYAYASNKVDIIPTKIRKNKLPKRVVTFLIIKQGNEILFSKRNHLGVWKGLWSFPEIPGEPLKKEIANYCHKHFCGTIKTSQTLEMFQHSFSHYHLMIHPVLLELTVKSRKLMESTTHIWYNLERPPKLGLPKPVKTILRNLNDSLCGMR